MSDKTHRDIPFLLLIQSVLSFAFIFWTRKQDALPVDVKIIEIGLLVSVQTTLLALFGCYRKKWILFVPFLICHTAALCLVTGFSLLLIAQLAVRLFLRGQENTAHDQTIIEYDENSHYSEVLYSLGLILVTVLTVVVAVGDNIWKCYKYTVELRINDKINIPAMRERNKNY
ncbi:unnamed protein product [Bursaphelenchus xylophilus]|uniref:(pine wood nematode) hypothetical protein n=1 Tax=Bursaphelenchus xylophilus TaxID=6326 RepID=A0A1I7RW71_BURXY|nr:unnamed protein product [Bursaphelenchus xylophilus]CAG9095212.1 unnamed protein product [Bursaphelenchus xylophilus]